MIRSGLVCTIMILMMTIVVAEPSAIGGDKNQPAADPQQLEDLEWLVGHWRGTGFGGTCEETWQPASGGSMIGTFKLVVDNHVNFYEIITLTIEDGEPTMRLKHFNPDLTGWEERDEVVSFPFVSSAEDELKFDGLSYTLMGEDSLQIKVRIADTPGEERYEVITCSRVMR